MSDLAACHAGLAVSAGATVDVESRYRTEAAFSIEDVAADWLALETATGVGTVFQSHSWCSGWLAASARVGRPEKALFVVVRGVRGNPLLIWPLCLSRIAGCRILHALGEPATQYCDALATSEPSVRARAAASAWNWLITQADVDLIILRRVRDDAAVSEAVTGACGSVNRDEAAYIDTKLAAGMAHWSGRRRRKLTQWARKLGALGEVSFQRIDDPVEKIAAVDCGVRFKRDWMRRRGLWSGGYSHPAADAFTRFLAPDPAFRVSVLRVEGEYAAVEVGYAIRDTYWCLTRSYDARYAAFSPSHLLGQRSLADTAANGVSRIDLLPPLQPFKSVWCTGTVGVRDVYAPLTWRGAAFASVARTARPAAKRLLAMASSAGLGRAAAEED